MTYSNPENLPTPNDEFEELIGQVDVISIQQGILDDANARFRIEWDESNLTRDLLLDPLSELPDGCNLKLSLYRRYNGHAFSHEIGVLLEDLGQPGDSRMQAAGSKYVPVAKLNQNGELLGSLVGGMKKADPRRDEHAALLHGQYRALMDLSKEGYLPNLSLGLKISEPHSEFMIRPPATDIGQ